jgi:midasin
LIEHLAKKLDIPLYRVNLSEQTDLIDLLGSDVPSDTSSAFKWADGVLIKAMKEGAWLLLDELNMASQTVLEGLNSILDHRGSIYLPELDKTVEKSPGFRIFASQNPTSMGSGRKGLPHSFLTRFTRIWLEAYTETELKQIIYDLYPETKTVSVLRKLLRFFFSLKEHFGKQATRHGDILWEFNLRDLHLMFDHLNQQSQSEEVTTEQVSETLVCTLLYRLPEEYHTFFHKLYTQIFNSPLTYTLRSRLDSEKETPFPFSLNLKSLKNLLPVV